MEKYLAKLGLTLAQAKTILKNHSNGDVGEALKKDVQIGKLSIKNRELDKRVKLLIDMLEASDRELQACNELKNAEVTEIAYSKTRTKSTAIPVMVASDWHVDEIVTKENVNGKNEYNKEVAQTRAENFFRNSLSLLKIVNRDVKIDTAVLALLGDFISGNIHTELLENTSQRPIDAIMFVKSLMSAGIRLLLNNTNYNFIIPCCVGNHSRITPKVHISTEGGNSLETMLYASLAGDFANEPRARFIVSPGYHCYLTLENFNIRFHHGHSIKFYGGVGGITIPVNKAIAQWNKLIYADLDVIGHFHQRFDGGNFLCNGSLIGYNAYALRIKASYEKPQQLFFVVDKKRGKTIVAPIILD